MSLDNNNDYLKNKVISKQLAAILNSLRPGQTNLAAWQSGKMAISAVPGAGKSHSLAVASALTIAQNQLHDKKQLIIVTYTRSAAASIKKKINQCLEQLGLSRSGFMVSTIHGLALHIASRYPTLCKFDFNTVTLINPTPSNRIIRQTVENWLTKNPTLYQNLIVGQKVNNKKFNEEETEILRRQSVLRTEVLPSLAYTVIREAKSSGLTPDELEKLSQKTQDDYQVLTIASELYREYQQIMRSQNYIDYDDMILAALEVLNKEKIGQLWQSQIFAVFEDEAQDSSPLQERLITLLARDYHHPEIINLVRVGDPNQAINSTFTPADPIYFNYFCDQCYLDNQLATIEQAGRSSQIIIDAANFMLKWVNKDFQKTYGNRTTKLELPFREQDIHSVEFDDPQPQANPKPIGKGLEIYRPENIYITVYLIKEKILDLFTKYPESNAAILVRENRQGRFLAQQLESLKKEHDIAIFEVGEAERFCKIPQEILKLLVFLERPHSPDNLKAALEVLLERQLIQSQDLNALVTYPEKFIYPSPLELPQKPEVIEARNYCCQLLNAKLELPSYHLISFLGITLKYDGAELATIHKLADRINQQMIGKNTLKYMIEVLQQIINSERFEAFPDDSNEDQYTKNKQVTIITMHKAKGLDWDYVFLPFLHEDTLPGDLRVSSLARFLGEFTLAEVARAQIREAVHYQHENGKEIAKISNAQKSWYEAKRLKKAEEYRLLYVAMTRAKRLLWMSASWEAPFNWTTFRSDGHAKLQSKAPCPILPILQRQFFSKSK